jgi:hypothetical protein
MIGELGIGPADDVVEMWPGLGRTTILALAGRPASYVGVERGEAEAARTRAVLDGPDQRCIVAPTQRTGLTDGCATVVFGEALLTLEPAPRKVDIVEEAGLLRPGGRYAVHELLLTPDGLSESAKSEIQRDLTEVLHIGARPLTRTEWIGLLTDRGFEVRSERAAPMLLLDPRTFVEDEYIGNAVMFLGRTLRHPEVLPRLATMLRTFHRYRDNLGAITIVAERPPARGAMRVPE